MSIFIKVAGPRTEGFFCFAWWCDELVDLGVGRSMDGFQNSHRIPVSSNPFAKGEMNKNDSDDFGWNATGSFWGVTRAHSGMEAPTLGVQPNCPTKELMPDPFFTRLERLESPLNALGNTERSSIPSPPPPVPPGLFAQHSLGACRFEAREILGEMGWDEMHGNRQ